VDARAQSRRLGVLVRACRRYKRSEGMPFPSVREAMQQPLNNEYFKDRSRLWRSSDVLADGM
jgi:hypothetical protein